MERLSHKEYELIREEQTPIKENEIRVKAFRRRFPYVAYIIRVLKEGKHESVSLIASGQAIQILLSTIKLLRTRVEGVHASVNLEVGQRVLKFEPREEYKDTLEAVTKTRSRISLKAEVSLEKLDSIVNSGGYLPPVEKSDLIKPEDFMEIIKDYQERTPRDRGGEGEDRPRRGRGRGGRGGRRNNRRGGRRHRDSRDMDRGDGDRDRDRDRDRNQEYERSGPGRRRRQRRSSYDNYERNDRPRRRDDNEFDDGYNRKRNNRNRRGGRRNDYEDRNDN